MKATITQLKLKSPFHFFFLSSYAWKIIKQLNGSPHLKFKKKGVWLNHYTMTLWKNEEDLKKFAQSGAHLDAMKKSKRIAREIKTLTIETEKLPDWKSAKTMLREIPGIKF